MRQHRGLGLSRSTERGIESSDPVPSELSGITDVASVIRRNLKSAQPLRVRPNGFAGRYCLSGAIGSAPLSRTSKTSVSATEPTAGWSSASGSVTSASESTPSPAPTALRRIGGPEPGTGEQPRYTGSGRSPVVRADAAVCGEHAVRSTVSWLRDCFAAAAARHLAGIGTDGAVGVHWPDRRRVPASESEVGEAGPGRPEAGVGT